MMNLMITSLSLITASIFTSMTHPLAMGLTLLIQTLLICLITGFSSQSFWFSYILFLVFMGGLLVLFIYVTSLASNEMFSLSFKSIILTSTPLILMMFLIFSTDPLPWMNNIFNSDTLPFISTNHLEETSLSLSKLYNQPTSIMTLMLVMYLFLTLIAVVKITKISLGPLRKKN
uniref:NADH-ubiquinone oxidoreductase chain 6 n=1 Tax=Peltoperlopsis cebuano TaxID=2684674 RepID=A0A6B9P9S3_9NEOP|nr:NADH dehydrogenase subunit 6 [Peltoperlopsis cebuano]